MAGITTLNIGGTVIQPGETQHFWWNNAATGKVWTFSLDVHVPKYEIIFAPFVLQVEITRVEYRLNFNSIASQEQEVHFWLRNNGDHPAVCDILMAFTPAGAPGISPFVKHYWDDGPEGAVNTSATLLLTQTFSPPRKLMAFPVLQFVDELDDQTFTNAFIDSFVDGGVTKPGRFSAVVGNAVSQIVWGLDATDAVNNPLRVIYFFD
jgi:hypothetical protein